MIFTESNFNRIKDKDNYKDFNKYQTVEEFDTYIENTLDTEHINILLNGIVRIINIINKTEEDNGEIEIKELILKANLSRNKNSFKELLVNNLENSDDRIRVINRIIDKKLLDNLDKKIELLIKIEELCEYFYPDFSDKLIMKDFKETFIDVKKDESENINITETINEYKKPVSKIKIITLLLFSSSLIAGLFYLFYISK